MGNIVYVKSGPGCVSRGNIAALERRYPAIVDRAWSAVRHAGKAFYKAIADTRRMARAYRELSTMSDLELRDIGISRADIPVVVSGTYRRTRRPVSNPTSSGRQRRPPSSECRNSTG
jgi:uncharacterized protein YjiS (DUF1127 family)